MEQAWWSKACPHAVPALPLFRALGNVRRYRGWRYNSEEQNFRLWKSQIE
jgi:membrane protein YdbS with pleckstrin-like domain